MIAVTGAAGKTGRAVVKALAARGVAVRAVVHRVEQVAAVQAQGAGQVVAGDMRRPEVLAEAFRGARAVYHICPNVHPDEVAIGRAASAAARHAEVERLVYHSVLHPAVEAMPHHWQKMRVEELLWASGLACTMLEPAAYMQNVLAHWQRMAHEGCYPVPYAAGTRLALVDLEDVAEAAARVLTEPGHENATYELAGPEVLSQVDVAAVVGRQLGRPVQVVVQPREEWAAQARLAGLGPYQVETLLRMFEYYERRGFWANTNVLAWLLGRPPTTFAAFVERVARESE